mgnify:CR=1 FL=1
MAKKTPTPKQTTTSGYRDKDAQAFVRGRQNPGDYVPEADTPALMRVIHLLFIHGQKPPFMAANDFLQAVYQEDPSLLDLAMNDAAGIADMSTATREPVKSGE